MMSRSIEPPLSGFALESARAGKTLVWLSAFLVVLGAVKAGFRPDVLLSGLVRIIVSPDILINDYMDVAGIGPAMLNAGLCALIAVGVLRMTRVSVSGPLIAATFTVAGFALFGKNVANLWPGFIGSLLYSAASKRPFGENVIVALFGTALAPLASELAFGLGVPVPWNFALAVAAGAAAGFLLAPIARHVLDFHRGYNLYNTGFAAGFIGTVTMSGLKAAGVPLSGGFSWAELGPVHTLPYLAAFFAALIVAGIVIEPRWLKSYVALLKSPGRLVCDFVRQFGMGTTLINMGIMGFVASAVTLLIGGSWNGPVIGGILTIVGFAAFGKHPRNALPPMFGAAAMALLSRYGLDMPASQLAVLFASTLAPISGEYGALAGFAAGCIHLALVQVVGALHGGLNLYNNGFAGGMTAGLFIPVLEWVREWRRHEI